MEEKILDQFAGGEWSLVLIRMTGSYSGEGFVVHWLNGLPDAVRQRHHLERMKAVWFEAEEEARGLFDQLQIDLEQGQVDPSSGTEGDNNAKG